MTMDKWFLLWMNFLFVFTSFASPVFGSLISIENPPQETDLFVFERISTENGDTFVPELHLLEKRSVGSLPIVNSNVTSYVTKLNTSHQQLLVHWSGLSSQVLTCLAKNNQLLAYQQIPRPSNVYISYDYGKSFENVTHFFRIENETYASVDKFFSAKKEKRFVIFMDKYNKVLFTTKDYGRTISKISVPFEPAEILFHPNDPSVVLVYDAKQRLRITYDFGQTFVLLQEMVKSYFWLENHDPVKPSPSYTLIVQRIEPYQSTTLLAITDLSPDGKPRLSPLINHIEQISYNDDFMFAVRKISNTTNEMLISYRGGEFISTQFDSNLDFKSFHVVDTHETRLMVVVSHTETLSNLYISQIEPNQKKYLFRLSLERIFCFFPNNMWSDSWLRDATSETFADIHKVQGMRGIYLASQVLEGARNSQINPENLMSVITFDWGGQWKPIEAPKFDKYGQPFNCDKKKNCTLHVTQKFSQIYPVSRNAPILTSKSAPGIIIATGTVGTSLKGHHGVFVSRDAGLTWNHVLRESNYLFNMGDHGGIFTAVKQFRASTETFQVYYSFDEGETWSKFQFADKPMRIYGLMTEPGENTTVFTVFGSEITRHEWIIINIDFQKAFPLNCTKDDYKMWSPSSSSNVKMSCILGRQETYERRIRHTKCFNGIHYSSPIKFEPCFCDIEDFECDYGFLRHVSSPDCIRNRTDTSDPYKIPDNCQPGEFYERTKGYRKIDGDSCIRGFENNYLPDRIPCPLKEPNQFVLLAQKKNITRFNLLDPKPENLPVTDLRNVISIDYDMKNNCVYFADIVLDVIGRQCFATGKQSVEILIDSYMRSVEGIALDWISNLLYFVDGSKATIDVIRTDVNHSGRMRKTILNGTHLGKPRGIALHPVRGYMFWTDWDEKGPSVSRANSDGSDIKFIAKSPLVQWPNGITIDYIGERVYWVDAKLDYIATADLEGRYFRKILSSQNEKRIHHPFSIAVFKDTMYWDDWTQNAIFMADKDYGTGIQPFAILYPGLMDIKVFGHSLQGGTNECHPFKKKCSHLCLALPNGKYTCACPDGLLMLDGKCVCPNTHLKPNENDTCPKDTSSRCQPDQFSCADGSCIPKTWQCNDELDCSDGSDEVGCRKACALTYFDCGEKCIPGTWKCDGDKDCLNGADEKNCTKPVCKENQFQCGNGRCINKSWVCDGDNDCKDSSDEMHCSEKPTKPTRVNCTAEEFYCGPDAHIFCIPARWVCDGEEDCSTGLDEKRCEKTVCNTEYQFQCNKTGQCINKGYVCDGARDCGPDDDSDEINCPTVPSKEPLPTGFKYNCQKWMFECNSRACIPSWWKCDGIDDCGDMSDEQGCAGAAKTSTTPMPEAGEEKKCHLDEFRCDNGACIAQSWVCDGASDCSNDEDERHCKPDHNNSNRRCQVGYIGCRKSSLCIPEGQLCDNIKQCPDGSDESLCGAVPSNAPENPNCAPGFFSCDNSVCLPLSKYCNNVFDCYDNTDEDNCSTDPFNRVYQVAQIEVDEYRSNPDSITLLWWVSGIASSNITLEFLPSIAEIIDGSPQIWKNDSWITDYRYTFKNLLPYTKHNLTIYVKLGKLNKVFPPGQFVTATTAPDIPSEPHITKLSQIKENTVFVQWLPPQKPNGLIIRYEVFVKPPMPPNQIGVDNQTHALVNGHFTHGVTYSVWVNAINQVGHASSSVVTFVADNSSSIPPVSNFHVIKINDTAIKWAWDPMPKIIGYKLDVSANLPYAHLPSVTTNETNHYFLNLAPGVEYTFFIRAFNKGYDGPKIAKGGRTSGDELPVVRNVKAHLTEFPLSAVLVSWTQPLTTKYKERWTYGVYYSTNSSDFFEGPKNVTQDNEMLIAGLGACEKYMIDVGLIGPRGAGPLTGAPKSITTGQNPQAPPKSLRAVIDRHNDTRMHIMWSSSCKNLVEAVGYVLTVIDEVTGKTTSVTFLPSNATEWNWQVTIQYGARYKIFVQTSVESSRPTQPVFFIAPQLPSPHQIEARFHSKENSPRINVYWALPSSKILLPPYKYEILVSEGKPLTESEAKIIVAKEPPYTFEDIKTGTIYYFAVRIVTERGYKSAISEITTQELPLGTWERVMTPTNVIGLFLPVILVLVLVAGAFLIFVFRHRRLQNNFTSFANSHYSSRLGAATFTTDGLDDEDSPVIRGFSDDEPLVVA